MSDRRLIRRLDSEMERSGNSQVFYLKYSKAEDLVDVLKQVSLPPWVDEALLHQAGKYAPYLDLAIACEQSDNDNVAALAQAIGLDLWRVSSFHIDAMLWAQEIGE